MSFPRTMTPDHVEDLEVEVEALQLQIADLISEVLAQEGITKAELARRLSVSSAHVTQMLSGERNLTLRSVAEVLYALDQRLEADAVPLGHEPEPVHTPEPHRARVDGLGDASRALADEFLWQFRVRKTAAKLPAGWGPQHPFSFPAGVTSCHDGGGVLVREPHG